MSNASEETLHCMEILGGNRAARRFVHAPGVDVWIDSRPLDAGAGGGDVHYVSTCGGGQVTRLALADVAGHGGSVDSLAVFLRKLMRKYINTLNQTRFAQALNKEFAVAAESGRFATALLLTYFTPTGHLIVCNAGHGRPLRYSARRDAWESLDLDKAGDCSSVKTSKVRYHFERVANLPLGVLDPIEYEQFAIDFEGGDLVLLYTDAVVEGEDAGGRQLGESGLLALLAEVGSVDIQDLGERLLEALAARRGARLPADDQTLILLKRTDAPAPGLAVLRTVSTVAKMLGLRRV
jgi:sigma-B regulation protein RsbU (phosphoserine phosphatase)